MVVLLVCQEGQAQNIWVADVDGGNASRVTNFRTGSIFGVDWARDSKQIIFSYGEVSSDVVLIKDFR